MDLITQSASIIRSLCYFYSPAWEIRVQLLGKHISRDGLQPYQRQAFV